MTHAVVCQDVSHSYGDRKALDAVGLTVASGTIVGLLGPNGGGKTTLFKILCTLLRPTSGSARVMDVDVLEDPAAVRSRIGVVFQHPSVDPMLTVEENLTHQGHLYGLRSRALRERATEVMRLLRLEDRGKDRVSTLSGGLKRRVDLAKGLLHRPGLLILDEPSTGLDPGIRREFWRDLERLRRSEGLTVLLTTHLMEEASTCDRVVILDRGRVVGDGVPAELTRDLGEDVITIATADPARMAEDLRREAGLKAVLLDGAVVVSCTDGGNALRQVLESFRDRIDTITVGRPTLEDVFLQRTGHRLSRAEDR